MAGCSHPAHPWAHRTAARGWYCQYPSLCPAQGSSPCSVSLSIPPSVLRSLPCSVSLSIPPSVLHSSLPSPVSQRAAMPCHARPLPCDAADAVSLHAQHGPVYWWRFLGRRMLMIGSYGAAKELLRGEHSTGAHAQLSCLPLHPSTHPLACLPACPPSRSPPTRPLAPCLALCSGSRVPSKRQGHAGALGDGECEGAPPHPPEVSRCCQRYSGAPAPAA